MAEKKVTRIVFILALFSLVYSRLVWGVSETKPVEQFFSPFDVPARVAPGWEQKPISYRANDKGADLVVSLDQQLYPALKALIQQWAKAHALKVKVHSGTCGISAGLLAHKQADIGGYCCPPGRTDRLPGLQFHTVGISPLALITHPDNPVNNLSLQEAKLIFQGEIYHWTELPRNNVPGLSKRPVQPVTRLHCKARPGHWHLLLNDADQFSPDIIDVGAIPDMIRSVATNRSAIGYETVWHIKDNMKKGRVKILTIDHLDPADTNALLAGKYPLYRTFNITSWNSKAASNPRAKELVRYLLQQADKLPPDFGMVSHSRLKAAGWRFHGDELIGAPE